MVQTDPSIPFSSAIVTLDVRRRLKVPKAILDALGWIGADAPGVLTVEIVQLGQLRMWDQRQVAPKLKSFEADLLEQDSREAREALRSLRDRHREVTLRPSDGRVQLSEPLHAIVEPTLKPCLLYAELGEGFVELFSTRGRLSRLRKNHGPSLAL